MEVTLLYFNDCPNWLQANDHLETLTKEIPGLVIHQQIVDTDEAAQQQRFHGSPSIQVDGRDLFADPESPVGLSCRIYQTPNGMAGSPSLDQLRDALGRAFKLS